MSKQGAPRTAISPTRAEDYPEWYQQVVKAADLAETSAVRGCMVIKPWGYAIWENMQRILDQRFKETGHVNAYFPLLIPLSYLEKEATHVDGFAKECAVVTHHRLIADGKGGLKPDGELEEPLIIRPTSETIIGATYAKWVQSYRDLPILVNQWANVMRWEMRTRMFLRTSEFLWQEGHTVHASSEEAMEETLKMLDVYEWFAEKILAVPVIKGEKTSDERFPGAENTYTIEAMMQDRKALQSGTSHFLGQNFAKASDIKFLDRSEKEQIAWTTSWGVSTRLIGALIMTHSDDDGLVLPPRLAPKHVVIIPIYRSDEDRAAVSAYCEGLAAELKDLRYHDEFVRVEVDNRELTGGARSWAQIKRGVPVRLEVGPREMAEGQVALARRDRGAKDKITLSREDLKVQLLDILDDIQTTIFTRAKKFRNEHSKKINSLDELKAFFTAPKGSDEDAGIFGGFAHVHAADDSRVATALKAMKLSVRCIPLDGEKEAGTCIFTGTKVKQRVVVARSY